MTLIIESRVSTDPKSDEIYRSSSIEMRRIRARTHSLLLKEFTKVLKTVAIILLLSLGCFSRSAPLCSASPTIDATDTRSRYARSLARSHDPPMTGNIWRVVSTSRARLSQRTELNCTRT
jgi:hypothetical protein